MNMNVSNFRVCQVKWLRLLGKNVCELLTITDVIYKLRLAHVVIISVH